MQLHLGWNSETGNTIDLLREFIDHCDTIGLAISSVQQITEKFTFHEGVWVFFVSTTGQGNPPNSMRLFWR
jgi:sulfite reductase alpha subunit-like flavoprotein